jgi:hypothetical protein
LREIIRKKIQRENKMEGGKNKKDLRPHMSDHIRRGGYEENEKFANYLQGINLAKVLCQK